MLLVCEFNKNLKISIVYHCKVSWILLCWSSRFYTSPSSDTAAALDSLVLRIKWNAFAYSGLRICCSLWLELFTQDSSRGLNSNITLQIDYTLSHFSDWFFLSSSNNLSLDFEFLPKHPCVPSFIPSWWFAGRWWSWAWL